MKTPKLLQLEGIICFGIPFLTALGIALSPYANGESAQPSLVGWLVIFIAPLVAGFSGLKSFLSTSYSDFKDASSPDASVTKTIAVQPTPEAAQTK